MYEHSPPDDRTKSFKEVKNEIPKVGIRNWIKRHLQKGKTYADKKIDPMEVDIGSFGSQLSCYESFRNQEIDQKFRELGLCLDFSALTKASSFQVSKLNRLDILLTPSIYSQDLDFEDLSPLLSQFSDGDVECSTESKPTNPDPTRNNFLQSSTSSVTSSSNSNNSTGEYMNENEINCISEIYMHSEVDKMLIGIKKDNKKMNSLYFEDSATPPLSSELEAKNHLFKSSTINYPQDQVSSIGNEMRYQVQTINSEKHELDIDWGYQKNKMETNSNKVIGKSNEISNIVVDPSSYSRDTDNEIACVSVQKPRLVSRNKNQGCNYNNEKESHELNGVVEDDDIENSRSNNNNITNEAVAKKKPSIKFHSKTKMLIYDCNSHASSLKRIFSGSKVSSSNSLRKLNRSLSLRISSLSSINTESTLRIPRGGKNNNMGERSNLKSKVNANREVESVRATNCDEVNIDDFMCFFETHERRRLDSGPYLNHYRERQIENYYINN